MKKFLESDSFLKIASVVIAIILWLYIIVVLDPAVEVEVRDLPIQFVGQEQLETDGLSIVSESATSINVKLKGSRKKMGRYDMKTIIAKVDLSGIAKDGKHKLPVDIVVPFENAGISSQSHYHVDVQVEKTKTKELKIEVMTSGSLAKDYMPDETTINPQFVLIKGPESVVEKIERAGVQLHYANANVDIKETLPIQLFDSDGRELTGQDALLNRVSQNMKETTVSCSVVKLRTVKISPQFQAETKEEKDLLSTATYSIDPISVQIYGNDEETAKITELLTEKIPMAKFTDNQKVKVALEIPKNVKVLGDVDEVEITLSKSMKAEKE